ncbi:MAG: 5'/3'-nucleotidase SurE [Gemmatimonadales bacterium]
MKILISNDDGILATGLHTLADACRDVGDVTVVAPDREQSGTSHSLTLHRPLRPLRRDDGTYQIDGTPTDCVLVALGTLLDSKPDFVFSGINHGPNMGEDVLYSGTVAAAMEGLSLGIPGIAMSFAGFDVALLETQRDWIDKLVRGITGARMPEASILNVNFPARPGSDVKGIRVTTLGGRVYSDSLMKTNDPWGRSVYWIGGGSVSWTGREDCDFRAVEEGYISVTPLHMDLTNYQLLEEVASWRLGD